MSEELTYEQFKALLQQQANQIMDTLALAATASLDVSFEIPEGIDELTDIAIGVNYLLEDMQYLLEEQQQLNQELETRVAERTAELEKRSKELEEALETSRRAQQRYLNQEWSQYTATIEDEALDEQIWQDALVTALEQEQIIARANGGQESTVSVPVSYGTELIGVLGFQAEDAARLGGEDLAAVEAIAEQVGLALENQRLFDQTQAALANTEQQAQNLAKLNEMAADLNTAISLEEIYRISVSRTLPILDATHVKLTVIDHQTGAAEAYTIDDTSLTINYQKELDLSGSMAQRVIQTNQVILIDDTQDKNWLASEVDRSEAQAIKARSLMLLPINVQARTWGLIRIASEYTNAFTANHQRLMQQVVSLLESSLANQYLFDQTQTALSESETLYDFSARLNTASTLEEIVSAVVDATNAETAALYITENISTSRKPAWAEKVTNWHSLNRPPTIQPGTTIKIQEIPAAEVWLMRPNEIIFIDDAPNDHRLNDQTRKQLTDEDLKASAWIPLVINRRWAGLIFLGWVTPHTFTSIARRLYKTVMTQTAVAFSQYRLTQEVQERAANLEKLAEIEARLSQTTTEEEIITILADYLAAPEQRVALIEIETNQFNRPIRQTPTLIWEDGAFDYRNPTLNRIINLADYPSADMWINSPNNLFTIEDVDTDARFAEEEKEKYRALGIRAMALLPMRSGGIWQGSISFTSNTPFTPSSEQKFILDRIIESISAIVSSRRAQAAQRTALAETEMLYSASVEFNRATTVDGVLQVIEQALMNTGVTSIALSQIEVDQNGRPFKTTITAIRRDGKSANSPVLNQSFLVDEYPGSELWADSPTTVQLFGNVHNDLAGDPYQAAREWLLNLSIQAIAFLPLTIGRRWVGLITLQWDSPYRFDEEDYRLYTTLSAQAATALDGLVLLQETQNRAAQLEMLTQVEADLSQARAEDDFVLALTKHFPDISMITLNYIDPDENGNPHTISPVSAGTGGQTFYMGAPAATPIIQSPFSELWLETPHQSVYVENLPDHPDLSDHSIALLEEAEIATIAMIPLHVGGGWQGLVTFTWAQTHPLSLVEEYVFQQVQEPLAAMVATRRSQIEQKRAEEALRRTQQETQQLYEASRRINESANQMSEIAAAIGEVRPNTPIDRVILMLFNYEKDLVSSVYVAGNWWRGTGPQPTPIGTTFDWQTNADRIQTLITRDSSYISNTQTESSIAKPAKEYFAEKQIITLINFPLLVGNRQVGTLILESAESYTHTDEDKRIYDSLLPQVAVAIENKTLLDASQARARREQILREITEKVRRSTDIDTIMRTAAQEVGRALGRKTSVYLDQDTNSENGGQA